MPGDAEVLAAVTEALHRRVPGIEPDSWAPSVQGAVGHVVGMHDATGARFVLKVYPPNGSGPRETEELALRLLAGRAGVRVPRPVLPGIEPRRQRGYLLMTRLDGVRWADRRPTLAPTQAATLTAEVGRALRSLHAVRGPSFGSLRHGGCTWPTAWDMVAARAETALREYRSTGGPLELARLVQEFVHDHRAAVESCPEPALCHNDFIDGNLLVAAQEEPRLCGVVDFERASWNDPMSDLAQTSVHVRHHDPSAVAALTAGYGPLDADERQRVDVHELLHLIRERSWIAHNRPAGWQQSTEALDGIVTART